MAAGSPLQGWLHLDRVGGEEDEPRRLQHRPLDPLALQPFQKRVHAPHQRPARLEAARAQQHEAVDASPPGEINEFFHRLKRLEYRWCDKVDRADGPCLSRWVREWVGVGGGRVPVEVDGGVRRRLGQGAGA